MHDLCEYTLRITACRNYNWIAYNNIKYSLQVANIDEAETKQVAEAMQIYSFFRL